jgi:hypothetical protein
VAFNPEGANRLGMTKLRHDRPLLRYLDNTAREYRKLQALPYFAIQSQKAPLPERRYVYKEKNQAAFDQAMKTYDLLPVEAQASISDLIETAQAILDARLTLFQSMKSLSSKKNLMALDQAKNDCRAACVAFNKVCAEVRVNGVSPARSWWAKFRLSMGPEWENFLEIDEFINQTRTHGSA